MLIEIRRAQILRFKLASVVRRRFSYRRRSMTMIILYHGRRSAVRAAEAMEAAWRHRKDTSPYADLETSHLALQHGLLQVNAIVCFISLGRAAI